MADNTSSHPEDEEDWGPYNIAAAIISFLFTILIVTLNGRVIITLLQKKNRNSRLHFFILHLAIADLLVGVVLVLGDAIVSSMSDAWYGGDFVCKLWKYVCVVVAIASNNLLIGLSVDRFLAIAYPMMIFKRGSILDRSLVIGAWIISALLSSINLRYSVGQNGTYEEGGGCILDLPSDWWKPYLVIVTVAIYVLPLIVILTCYTGICVVVWRKWKQGMQLSELTKLKGETTRLKTQTKGRAVGYLPRAKIQSIKMTVAVCLAFVFSWTPYFVITLMDVFEVKSIEARLNMVLMKLYPINSVVNPIIFILFNIKMFVKVKTREGRLTNITEEDMATEHITTF